MLRRDIGRRLDELTLLGWLGRAYLLAPSLVDRLLPALFAFGLYQEPLAPPTDEQIPEPSTSPLAQPPSEPVPTPATGNSQGMGGVEFGKIYDISCRSSSASSMARPATSWTWRT